MRFLERTKVYGWNEFCGLEARKEVERVDKQIGIWKRTHKKAYRALIILIATVLYCGTLTVMPVNMEMYNILSSFSQYGTIMIVLLNSISNVFTEGKNFLEENIGSMYDGVSSMCILITFARYLCSSIIF